LATKHQKKKKKKKPKHKCTLVNKHKLLLVIESKLSSLGVQVEHVGALNIVGHSGNAGSEGSRAKGEGSNAVEAVDNLVLCNLNFRGGLDAECC
jgi:hypothetical protein